MVLLLKPGLHSIVPNLVTISIILCLQQSPALCEAVVYGMSAQTCSQTLSYIAQQKHRHLTMMMR